MPALIGIALSLAVAVLGRRAGFDRDRAFYATITIVVASYYVLFAVVGGSTPVLVVETMVMALFVAAAVVGFRSGAWLIAAHQPRGAGLVAGFLRGLRSRSRGVAGGVVAA